jgi:hypothetical protein
MLGVILTSLYRACFCPVIDPIFIHLLCVCLIKTKKGCEDERVFEGEIRLGIASLVDFQELPNKGGINY